jgi:WD40 repeat protein
MWEEAKARVWDLASLPDARPLSLRRAGSWYAAGYDWHPSGDWRVVDRMNDGRVAFWPLRKAYPIVLEGCTGINLPIAFSPDSRWLAASCIAPPEVHGAVVRLWPLPKTGPLEPRTLSFSGKGGLWSRFAFEPKGRFPRTAGRSTSRRSRAGRTCPRGEGSGWGSGMTS